MSASDVKSDDRVSKGIEGRHVLMGLFAFFGVMLVANGFLVYYALGTFSGGERQDPYRSGLNYNQTIAEAERQAALGWNVQVDYEDAAGRLVLRFVDKAAEPVSGLTLAAKLARPAENRKDTVLEFWEWRDGVYVSDIALDPGNWVLSVASSEQRGGTDTYRVKRRLFVSDGS